MDEINNKNEGLEEETKSLENSQDFLESTKKEDINITSLTDFLSSEAPISEDADMQMQLDYAEEKIEKFYKDQNRKKAIHNKMQNADVEAMPLHKKDGDVRPATLRIILNNSKIGKDLLAGHKNAKVSLTIDNQIFSVRLHRKSQTIGINHQMTYGEAIFRVAKELRRAWLSTSGDVLYPLAYKPDDAVLMHRILEADCRVAAIWVAWELKLKGFDSAWDYVLHGNEAFMAKAFARKAREDFRNVDNGLAAHAAFDAFFESAMIKRIDHKVIQQMLADDKGYVFGQEQFEMTITPALVDFIAEMPGEKNYLTHTSEKPLPDTEYSIVRDRSNANFLWFVKFEKSFQETEQEIIAQEKEKKTREKNIEESRKEHKNIEEIIQSDEKVVDFTTRFRQKLVEEENHSSSYEPSLGQFLDQTELQEDRDNVVSLFVDPADEY
ncbi:MAG: hypothetical protein CMP22_01165 [Rickettsiales bacterium]|nr:hypothetical protein [Rickettsiales bacterium]